MVVPDAIAQLSRDDLTGEMRLARSADVAALITARRKELGWTRTGLAERAGVSHPTVSMVESGKRKAGMETTLLLFAALSLELWAFPRAVEETS
jgi:transcriptional regulator with XRE-family HTH domain